MTRVLEIEKKIISDSSESFIIAEIGHNHRGSLEDCKKLFDAALESGVDAVKLQKRENKTLYTKQMYDWNYTSENAYANTYGEHREALEFNLDQYKELKEYAEKIGIIFFATPFDIPSADFLNKLDIPLYKISSSDLKNHRLVEYVAKFNKPMIISTGGATLLEVEETLNKVIQINSKICLMQCVSSYPAEYEQLNLNVIKTFRDRFKDIVIGFSSHDSGVTSVISAYHLGARIFEKHFTLNRTWKGTDHAFSLEPMGLKRIVRDLRRARISLGSEVKSRLSAENKPMSKMEKIMVASSNLKSGTVLNNKNVEFKIPHPHVLDENCLSPNFLNNILGKIIKADLDQDDPIKLSNLS